MYHLVFANQIHKFDLELPGRNGYRKIPFLRNFKNFKCSLKAMSLFEETVDSGFSTFTCKHSVMVISAVCNDQENGSQLPSDETSQVQIFTATSDITSSFSHVAVLMWGK